MWAGKPYYSLDAYCKQTFQHKCYKIALDAGMTCPNRDGSLDSRGCIFCSAGGSGDFAAKGSSVSEQLAVGKALLGRKRTGNHFIAYFQSYTNTYAPVPVLRRLYTEALEQPEVCGISIATRPDCLPEQVLSLLTCLQTAYPQKFIWIELGLQTIHARTAAYIRRGYPLSTFAAAFSQLKKQRIPAIVHVILGLPGESAEDMYETIRYINSLKPFGVKLQLLHVLAGTDLAADYQNGRFEVLTKESYLKLLTGCLERLSPDIVVHRVTGDGPKALTIAPLWSLNKRDVLNSLHHYMKENGSYQGRYVDDRRSIDSV